MLKLQKPLKKRLLKKDIKSELISLSWLSDRLLDPKPIAFHDAKWFSDNLKEAIEIIAIYNKIKLPKKV